jgi:protein O-mannosyl-transferase
MLSCILEPEERVQSRLASIEAAARGVGFILVVGVVESLQGVHDLVERGVCPAISWPMLESVNRVLLENRFVQARQQIQGLYVNLHNIFREQGEYSRTMTELDRAWQINRNHGIAYPMVDLWLTQKMFQEATHFAEHEMCREMPRNPILAHAAQERCKSVQEWIRNAKTQATE